MSPCSSSLQALSPLQLLAPTALPTLPNLLRKGMRRRNIPITALLTGCREGPVPTLAPGHDPRFAHLAQRFDAPLAPTRCHIMPLADI